MYKIGYAGSDARTLLSALVTSTSTSERGSNNYQGLVVRGNNGMAAFAQKQGWGVEFIPTEDNSVHSYTQACLSSLEQGAIDCVFPMPEALFFEGFVDNLREAGHGDKVIGLDTTGSFIESDKIECKKFCDEYRIPVADEWYSVDAKEYKEIVKICLYLLDKYNGAVLKYPYGAGGKGARLITDIWEIEEVYSTLMSDYKKDYKKMYQNKRWPLLIESMMSGAEISFTILVDREGNYRILPTAMDYPERFAGPKGVNNPITGGMGSISPHPLESPELMELVAKEFADPMIRGMKEKGILRPCVLYPGCFVSVDNIGKPTRLRASEVNIRPGEPEFQPVIRRIRNLGDLVWATLNGKLNEVEPEVREDQVSINAALVTGPGGPDGQRGYPWSYTKGEPIEINYKYFANKKIQIVPSGLNWDDDSESFYSDGTRVAYMNANATVEESGGEAIVKTSEQLRNRILSAFENNKIRVIPREDQEGNRLDIRRDIGHHYSITHRIFG